MAKPKSVKWEWDFETDASQGKSEAVETLMTIHALMTNPQHQDPSIAGKLLRQRRAKPRFSDVVRAGMEAADNCGRPTLEDLQRENAENLRRRDDRHGRQP